MFIREHGGSVVERRTPERESRVQNIPLLCCVLDTLLPERTVNTLEAMTPPNMTNKLLTGTLSLNTNKQMFIIHFN